MGYAFLFLFFSFFGILEWVLKERTNNKTANLSTKWVDQWGMVGYAHKKYKDNIFFNETKLNPPKRE